MSVNEDLIERIQSALGRAVTSNLGSASAVSDLFEAYVFSLVLRAAAEEGADIEFRNVHDRPTSSFVFRTSPGYISSTAQDYTHAVVAFPNTDVLEAHVGIYISGKSQVIHESDVAVLWQTEAVTCRRNPGAIPRHTRVLLSAECKFYSSRMSLGMGRAFLGLCTDIHYGPGDRFFVMNTDSGTVERLLTKHKRSWEHHLVPGSDTEEGRMIPAFREVFKRFKSSA